MVFTSPMPGEPVWMAPAPAISGGFGLVLLALLFNNLTRMPYPRRRNSTTDNHQPQDPPPGAREGIQPIDLDRALEELAAFVDITRDDLERIVRSTERHALRRSMGDTRARQVMSRDRDSQALQQACGLLRAVVEQDPDWSQRWDPMI